MASTPNFAAAPGMGWAPPLDLEILSLFLPVMYQLTVMPRGHISWGRMATWLNRNAGKCTVMCSLPPRLMSRGYQ